MTTMADLLTECADIHLICNNSAVVKANKFTLLSKCPVLRDMHQDLPVQGEILLHGLEADQARLAVDVLHGVVQPQDMTAAGLATAIEGLDFLGCAITLHGHLWRHVGGYTDAVSMIAYASRFMHHTGFRGAFLNRFVANDPSWTAFCTLLGACGGMTTALARYIVTYAPQLFPTGVVVEELLKLLSPSTVSVDDMLSIFHGRPGIFAHHHEVHGVTHAMMKWIASKDDIQEDRGKATIPFLRFIIDAFDVHDIVPYRMTTGSTIMFTTSSKVSVLVDFTRTEGRNSSMKPTPWLWLVRKTTPQEDVSVRVDIHKIDKRAREAVHVQIHTLAVARDATRRRIFADAWHFVRGADVHDEPIGIPLTHNLRELLKLKALETLYVTVFFGAAPINSLVIFQ